MLWYFFQLFFIYRAAAAAYVLLLLRLFYLLSVYVFGPWLWHNDCCNNGKRNFDFNFWFVYRCFCTYKINSLGGDDLLLLTVHIDHFWLPIFSALLCYEIKPAWVLFVLVDFFELFHFSIYYLAVIKLPLPVFDHLF